MARIKTIRIDYKSESSFFIFLKGLSDTEFIELQQSLLVLLTMI